MTSRSHIELVSSKAQELFLAETKENTIALKSHNKSQFMLIV